MHHRSWAHTRWCFFHDHVKHCQEVVTSIFFYGSVFWEMRTSVSVVLAASFVANMALSILYLVSVTIFLSTRMIVNTTEVLGFVVPLAAIFIYLAVVPAKMKETQAAERPLWIRLVVPSLFRLSARLRRRRRQSRT